jgi:ABC-type branched-subunit amino acid transport system substrate-binding protein
MGAVYAATQLDLGRRVAIKVLHAPAALQDEALLRLRREAKAAAALRHPHIVQVTDFHHNPGEPPFLVMEYLEGEPLGAALARDGVFRPRRLVAIAAQVLAALGAAHRVGIVHRDIKPDNIFLTSIATARDVVKLLDFGLAKFLAERANVRLTGAGIGIGTPYYMSPEQARGEEVDGRADIYGLGASMYHALTGAVPIEGNNIPDVMVAIMAGAVVPLRARKPKVDPGLAWVIERALAKDRAARFANAAEMADALRPWLSEPKSRPEQVPLLAYNQPEAEPTLRRGALAREVEVMPAPSLKDRFGRFFAVGALGAFALAAAVGPRIIQRNAASAAPAPTRCLRNDACLANAVCGSAGQCIPRKGCASNEECTRTLGEAAVCRKESGACVRLASQDCTVLADAQALKDDATIWVGTMFPTHDLGPCLTRSADLARRDIAMVTGGIPTVRDGQAARPLALVACDDGTDPARPARHLVEELGVPAVVGFAGSKEVVDLASTIFLPQRVLTIAAPNRSSMIDDIVQPEGGPRLVWRTTAGFGRYAEAMAALASDVFAPKRSGDLRVAIVHPDTDTGLSYSDGLLRALHARGIARPSHLDNVRQFMADDSAAGASAVAPRLRAYAPHVVYTASLELVRALEHAWAGRAGSGPVYVNHVLWDDPSLPALLDASPNLRKRLLSIHTPHDTIPHAQLRLRYAEAFPDAADIPEESSYDAIYLVAYAAGVVGDAPVSGPSLARAFQRVTSTGTPIEVGPAHLLEAFGVLKRGGNIDLNGSGTLLDFDLATGEPASDFSVLCLRERSRGVVASVNSGLRYDARAQRLRGELRCP